MRLLSVVVILALVLEFGVAPGMLEHVHKVTIGEVPTQKVDKNGVLERKLRLRSRLNTQLLYKKW